MRRHIRTLASVCVTKTQQGPQRYSCLCVCVCGLCIREVPTCSSSEVLVVAAAVAVDPVLAICRLHIYPYIYINLYIYIYIYISIYIYIYMVPSPPCAYLFCVLHFLYLFSGEIGGIFLGIGCLSFVLLTCFTCAVGDGGALFGVDKRTCRYWIQYPTIQLQYRSSSQIKDPLEGTTL